MKNLTITSLLLLLTLAISGCTPKMSKGPELEEGAMESTTQTTEEDAAMSEQPPVSSSTEVEDIETELDGTVILEEDFSDL